MVFYHDVFIRFPYRFRSAFAFAILYLAANTHTVANVWLVFEMCLLAFFCVNSFYRIKKKGEKPSQNQTLNKHKVLCINERSTESTSLSLHSFSTSTSPNNFNFIKCICIHFNNHFEHPRVKVCFGLVRFGCFPLLLFVCSHGLFI